MICKITFAATANRSELILRNINAVHIESGWKRLTDTAEITLPRKAIYLEQGKKSVSFYEVKEYFKKGDAVTIELGYNGVYVKEFEGYITHVSADIPIKIKLEDEMYQLKKLPVNISFQTTSLENLLKKIIPGYEVDALEVELGSLRFAKTTVAKVLEYLKDEYSLYSYMDGKKLVCGKIYADDSDAEAVDLHLEKNVVNNDLNYKDKEDVLIRINAVSTLKNGDKIEVTVGDETGEERQLSYYGIEIEAELTKLANEDLKKYKVDGFTGSVKAFGIPFFKHGMKANLTSDLYPDRNGLYYIEETIVDFNDTPSYRRKGQLGDKVTT
ncbi:hypothetical protein MC378_10445 [Polaribacter sp. MSW13]|uniref:Phage protein D n=1 Tax=Polaribacter marinus TaxID=2916838 RepID=A0A9X2AK12_9FLAO|nr:hypothetical protein [Polaribacter marinus]MCI2229587.1 hypothetical protein [Polaribacter marinus]